MSRTPEADYRQHYQSTEAAARYERQIYRSDGHDALIWDVEQTVLDRLLGRYGGEVGKSDALDFACGTGRILAYLKPRVGKLTGVDISLEMIKRAREKVADVELICTDILKTPESLAGRWDLITSFRFLLLAGPSLRRQCIRALAKRLRDDKSILILNSHRNPHSVRLLSNLKRWLLGSGNRRPSFSLSDMRRLAEECDLELVAATGLGYLPIPLCRVLPRGFARAIERLLADRPLLWRWGSNLFFVLRRVTRGQ